MPPLFFYNLYGFFTSESNFIVPDHPMPILVVNFGHDDEKLYALMIPNLDNGTNNGRQLKGPGFVV